VTIPSTLTFTPTPLPATLTPLPTLAPDEAAAFVRQLLNDNADCELPCYWGVTPGVSSWESAYQRFSTFADKIGQGSSDQLIRDGVSYERTVFTIYKLIPDYSDVVAAHYYISNGTVFQIGVEPRGTEIRYSLHQLLTRFGEPDGIVIRILADTPMNKPWYDLILFYQHKGIIAQFSSPAYYETQKLQICPQKVAPNLILIEPDSLTLSAMKRASYGSNFPSIEKLLNMEIDQFYEQMRHSNACLSIDPEILSQ
jgi:hypothetical protein